MESTDIKNLWMLPLSSKNNLHKHLMLPKTPNQQQGYHQYSNTCQFVVGTIDACNKHYRLKK